MTAHISAPRRLSERRAVRATAAATSLVLIAAGTSGLLASNASAAPATKYSTTATARFLSGSIASTNLDTLASIAGESASNKFGPTVTNANSLDVSVLNGAIRLPLQNGLQLPGLDILKLGAVSQYASASPNGSALGAAGAVDSNGGIGVGGTNGVPTGGATLDLSGLGGGALSSLLNIQAKIGAISSRAVQAAGAAGAQTGKYNIAGLRLELDLPILKNLLGQVTTTLGPTLDGLSAQLTNALGALGGLATIEIPSLTSIIDQLSKVDIAEGSITVDLKTGTIVVDVEKLLQALGLDLNNLPPNTSLVPYIVKALADLPAALGKIVDGLVKTVTDLVGSIKVTVAGLDLSQITALIGGVLSSVTSTLTSALTPITKALGNIVDATGPVTDLLGKLLDIIVNGQSTSDKIFTETALALKIGDGLGLDLSSITGILSGLGGGTLPLSVRNAASAKIAAGEPKIQSALAATAAKAKAYKASGKSGSGASNFGPVFQFAPKAIVAKAAARPVLQSGRVAALAPSSALVALNLAQTSVGPSTAAAPPTTPPASNTPTVTPPTTGVPTGVPAGAAADNGSTPVLPLTALLLGLVVGAGVFLSKRMRGKYTL